MIDDTSVCGCSVNFSDIDECETDNGGCEQHCKNVPGAVECSCERGLQIDTSNGKTCVGKFIKLYMCE